MQDFNIWILFDCPDDRNDKKWLIDELSKLHNGNVRSVSIKKTLSILDRQGVKGKIQWRCICLWQAIRAAKYAQENDVIICWTQRSGLYVNKALMGKRVKLVSMNWLTPSVHYLRHKQLLRSFVKNTRSLIVVNTPESIEKWENKLKFSNQKKFLVIPDVYNDTISFTKPKVLKEKYCFTGGMNNRNWKLILNLAKNHRMLKFVCVALKNDFEKQIHEEIPDNMDVYFDVPSNKYYDLMKNAYIVLLPLMDNRVAGLININRAAQYGVPCMITKTAATEQYYNADTNHLLVTGQVDEWGVKLDNWLKFSEEQYIEATEEFCDVIKVKFSPERAAKQIYDAIRK